MLSRKKKFKNRCASPPSTTANPSVKAVNAAVVTKKSSEEISDTDQQFKKHKPLQNLARIEGIDLPIALASGQRFIEETNNASKFDYEASKVLALPSIAEIDKTTEKISIPIKVATDFDANSAFYVLNNLPEGYVSNTSEFQHVTNNTIFVFDLKCYSDTPYWRDTKSWTNVALDKDAPRRNPKLVRNRFILNEKGMKLDFMRHEYWQHGKKFSELQFCYPKRVLIHYKGSFDYKKNVNAPHGNLKTKTQAVQITKKELLERYEKIFGEAKNKKNDTSLSTSADSGSGETSKEEIKPSFQSDNVKTCPPAEQATVFQNEVAYETGSKHTRPSAQVKNDIDEAINAGKPLAEAYRDLKSTKSDAPANLKQMHNRKFYKSRGPQRARKLNDISVAFALADDFPDTFFKVDYRPLLVSQAHPETMKHFRSLQAHNNVVVFHYDTTYDTGPTYCSILSARHPYMEGDSVISIACMLHESTAASSSHSTFFGMLKKLHPYLDSNRTIIITDREKSIRIALQEHIPEAKHLFCHNHLLKNVEFWCKGKSGNYADIKENVKNLLHANSEDDFNTLLSQFCNLEEQNNQQDTLLSKPVVWEPEFIKYFEKYLKKDVVDSCKFNVAKLGIFSNQSGITNNVSESMNKSFKLGLGKKKIYENMIRFYKWQTTQLKDIHDTINGNRSHFAVKPECQKLASKLPIIDVKEFNFFCPTENLTTPLENLSSRVKNQRRECAEAIVKSNGVSYVGDGHFLVKWIQNTMHTVRFKDCKCTCFTSNCVHVEAVFLDLGIVDDEKFKFLKTKRYTNLTRNYIRRKTSTVGKKPRGRVPGAKQGPKFLKSNNGIQTENYVQQTTVTDEAQILQNPQLQSVNEPSTNNNCASIIPSFETPAIYSTILPNDFASPFQLARREHVKQFHPDVHRMFQLLSHESDKFEFTGHVYTPLIYHISDADLRRETVGDPPLPIEDLSAFLVDEADDVARLIRLSKEKGHLVSVIQHNTPQEYSEASDLESLVAKFNFRTELHDVKDFRFYMSFICRTPALNQDVTDITLDPATVPFSATCLESATAVQDAATSKELVSTSRFPILKIHPYHELIRCQNIHLSLVDLVALEDPVLTDEELRHVGKYEGAPSGWVTDATIMAYLCEVHSQNETTVVAETLVVNRLLGLDKTGRNVERTFIKAVSKQIKNKPNFERLLLVCNPSQNHWVLLVANPKERRIDLYDPIEGYWVPNDSEQTKLFKALNCLPLPEAESKQWMLTSKPCLQQVDAKSCGVFICKYGEDLNSVGNAFNPIQFRKKMLDRLIGNCDMTQTKAEKKQICQACKDANWNSKGNEAVKCDRCNSWFHIRCTRTPLKLKDYKSLNFICE